MPLDAMAGCNQSHLLLMEKIERGVACTVQVLSTLPSLPSRRSSVAPAANYA